MHRHIYATDASVYRQVPEAITTPRDTHDIQVITRFCREHGIALTPRAAGTSLAGQAVGNALVVDVSKYMNKILELNTEERWARVQPGVIRDELNKQLVSSGLFFGPTTATSNRATIGGMVGNNSCGTTSIQYGSTRDHVLELHAVLSDGSTCVFRPLDANELAAKCALDSLEGNIYRAIAQILDDKLNQDEIRKEYPDPAIHRRNTGYALDLLLQQQPWNSEGGPFDLSRLICGSEGTLCLVTEIKLGLNALPPPAEALVCAHFHTLHESLVATQVAMTTNPSACELMDRIILECTKGNAEQLRNREFVNGEPEAILLVEFRGETYSEAEDRAARLIDLLTAQGLGYAYPVLKSPETRRAWNLRVAGLGVLGNLPGDAKAVACIEDTAVTLQDLPAFIDECDAILERYGQEVVHYAHAGAGEIHIRPIINLKSAEGQQKFYKISLDIAQLVKKYNGSLSGEHGDGRVRSEFIPIVLGDKNYDLLRQVKKAFDPTGILNPGKIVDPLPMQSDFRYVADEQTPEFDTVMDFSESGGYMRMIEKCNGVGACRKTPASGGGTMCPSYMATRNERDTTRSRANALREFLKSNEKANPFDNEEIFDILKYCLACKGCTNECPSSVDMTSLKSEFLHQYYKSNRRPLADRVFGHIDKLGRFATAAPRITNGVASSPLVKRILGVSKERSVPAFARTSMRLWFKKYYDRIKPENPIGKIHLFCDEFTNYQDAEIGITTIKLLSTLDYEVTLPRHFSSGRALLSKGFLDGAKQLANANVDTLKGLITPDAPLIGIEPSAILSFRDEYLRLADDKRAARQLATNVFQIEEFLYTEAQKGNLPPGKFTDAERQVLLHGHCHQKALSGIEPSAFILGLPRNYAVEVIPSGCCGMAGSFGYEEGKYDLSMQIAELVLFPAIRAKSPDVLIAAPGTSCRHQVRDGLGVRAKHPVEILYEALSETNI